MNNIPLPAISLPSLAAGTWTLSAHIFVLLRFLFPDQFSIFEFNLLAAVRGDTLVSLYVVCDISKTWQTASYTKNISRLRLFFNKMTSDNLTKRWTIDGRFRSSQGRPAEPMVWFVVYFNEQLLKQSLTTLPKIDCSRQFFFCGTGLRYGIVTWYQGILNKGLSKINSKYIPGVPKNVPHVKWY